VCVCVGGWGGGIKLSPPFQIDRACLHKPLSGWGEIRKGKLILKVDAWLKNHTITFWNCSHADVELCITSYRNGIA
jgi:hypothetical protein